MIQLGQQGHLHTKTVELEKVKRNRAALDIKGRFVFIYEEAQMRESGITKAIDLGVDLERMYSCEWKAEIDYFLGNRLD